MKENMENIDLIKELLNQIIEMAKVQSIELDKYNILIHKAMRTIGDNPVVFHLNLLKELVDEEAKRQVKV